MANQISEQLFEAIDVLVGKRILDDTKDKTILCLVEDDSKAENGEYIVSNASVRFTAFSENTKYRAGQNVWVLVPNGDYNNDKLIVSKYTKDSSSPFVYVDPMDTFINMTGNILSETVEEAGLLANCSYPLNLWAVGEPEPITDDDGQTCRTLPGDESSPFKPILISNINKISLSTNEPHLLNGVNISDYDKIGITADFKTAFGDNAPISGTYGLLFIIKTQKEIETGVAGSGKYQVVEDYVPLFFDSSMMWGNPYEYNDYFTQSAVFDLDQGDVGLPVGIDCYFYQNFDFINEDSTPTPYYRNTNFVIEGDQIIYEYLPDNLFVKNINLSFGYSIDDITEDTLRLYTNSNTTYIVDNNNYPKDLFLRYIYVGDNATRVAINGFDKLKEYMTDVASLNESKPYIHWYRYKVKNGVSDMRAGDFWEEIYPEDPFYMQISDLSDAHSEYFKCVLCYNSNLLYYLKSILKRLPITDPLYDFYNNRYMTYLQIAQALDLDVDSAPATKNEMVEIYMAKQRASGMADNELEEAERLYRQQLDEQGYDVYNDNDIFPIEEIYAEWAKTDKKLTSNQLEFLNKDSVYDSTLDRVQGLKLTPTDPLKGVFNLYEATFGADNRLLNDSDQYIARTIEATFWSAVAQDDSLNEAERLAWYIPKYNTMIKAPADGKGYGGYNHVNLNEDFYEPNKFYCYENGSYELCTDEHYDSTKYYYQKDADNCFRTKDDIDTYKDTYGLEDEEYDLYVSRIEDYYIILEDKISEKAEKTKSAILSYYIKPRLVKRWTNNTIRATAYRYKRVYEGENAQFTPTFSVKGANGTDYTLVIDAIQEFYGVKTNNNAYSSEWKTAYSPAAWTFALDSEAEDVENTRAMRLEAQLFDPNDVLIEDAKLEWTLIFPSSAEQIFTLWSGSLGGINGVWLRPANKINSYVADSGMLSYMGALVKCSAKISSNATEQLFEGYLTIPMRKSRDYIALEGPAVVAYNSNGVNPSYYRGSYGIIDFQEKINYNNYTEIVIPDDNPSAEPALRLANYFPTVQQKAKDNEYCLVPNEMYWHNVDYKCYVKISNGTEATQNDYLWAQPLYIAVDPFGNRFLNSWNGNLNIDYDNNSIMAATLGAGRKESNNSYTGLLMGDLPQVEGTAAKTGILGYEHGEQSYGLFDDGTLFLGKSSTARLKFDGSTGVLQNLGFGNGGPGMRLHFTGETGTGDAADTGPYLVMSQDGKKANKTSTSAVRLSAVSPYFQIWAPKTTSTSTAIVHIGSDDYYMQTSNFTTAKGRFVVSTTTQDRFEVLDNQTTTFDYASSGFKLDLANSELLANDFELLSVKGNNYKNGFIRFSAKANKYPLNINNKFLVDWTGAVTATRGKIGDAEIDDNGNLLVTGIWYKGTDNKYTKFMPIDKTFITSVKISVGTTNTDNTINYAYLNAQASTSYDMVKNIQTSGNWVEDTSGNRVWAISSVIPGFEKCYSYSISNSSKTITTQVVNSVTLNYTTWKGKILGGEAGSGSVSWTSK